MIGTRWNTVYYTPPKEHPAKQIRRRPGYKRTRYDAPVWEYVLHEAWATSDWQTTREFGEALNMKHGSLLRALWCLVDQGYLETKFLTKQKLAYRAKPQDED